MLHAPQLLGIKTFVVRIDILVLAPWMVDADQTGVVQLKACHAIGGRWVGWVIPMRQGRRSRSERRWEGLRLGKRYGLGSLTRGFTMEKG